MYMHVQTLETVNEGRIQLSEMKHTILCSVKCVPVITKAKNGTDMF